MPWRRCTMLPLLRSTPSSGKFLFFESVLKELWLWITPFCLFVCFVLSHHPFFTTCVNRATKRDQHQQSEHGLESTPTFGSSNWSDQPANVLERRYEGTIERGINVLAERTLFSLLPWTVTTKGAFRSRKDIVKDTLWQGNKGTASNGHEKKHGISTSQDQQANTPQPPLFLSLFFQNSFYLHRSVSRFVLPWSLTKSLLFFPPSVLPLSSPDGNKKAYIKLTADVDALDVANKIGFI